MFNNVKILKEDWCFVTYVYTCFKKKKAPFNAMAEQCQQMAALSYLKTNSGAVKSRANGRKHTFSLQYSQTRSSKVSPHKNCHNHHEQSVGVHNILPQRSLADVGHLWLWGLSCCFVLNLWVSTQSTQPTNQATDTRLFLMLSFKKKNKVCK